MIYKIPVYFLSHNDFNKYGVIITIKGYEKV